MKPPISTNEKKHLLEILQLRFEKNMYRHIGITWASIEAHISNQPDKLWVINEMNITDGEPDVIGYDKNENKYIFCDCSKESPKSRRSFCYDHEALNSRKEHKPKNSAINMASEIGIELLDEEQYNYLQSLENVDTKTSSWLKTPKSVRKLGGAIFGDFRFGRVFIYHNGAESYYAARGFRGMLKV
ncbi:MAG: DUF4256 domain-containing protein [Chitinophagaceae bacterium]|nr:DUF4256 domain-containing protein [Chitinophagaceae bacterium]MCW5904608.1 DUF4256 domain-containing protein [Chitinophagaceae bacterium]